MWNAPARRVTIKVHRSSQCHSGHESPTLRQGEGLNCTVAWQTLVRTSGRSPWSIGPSLHLCLISQPQRKSRRVNSLKSQACLSHLVWGLPSIGPSWISIDPVYVAWLSRVCSRGHNPQKGGKFYEAGFVQSWRQYHKSLHIQLFLLGEPFSP